MIISSLFEYLNVLNTLRTLNALDSLTILISLSAFSAWLTGMTDGSIDSRSMTAMKVNGYLRYGSAFPFSLRSAVQSLRR